MRRALGGAALGAVLVVAAPVVPASACSVPTPRLALDRERVARGGRIEVSASVLAGENGQTANCFVPLPEPVPRTSTPTPSDDPEPTETPSASESPLVTLPPLEPVAYGVPDPALVTFTIVEHRDMDAPPAPVRTIAVVPAGTSRFQDWNVYEYSFSTTVRIPRDTAPGRYVLMAFEEGGVFYGESEITVTKELAATGANGRIAASGLLLLGGVALLVRQQQAHRLGTRGRAVAERPSHG